LAFLRLKRRIGNSRSINSGQIGLCYIHRVRSRLVFLLTFCASIGIAQATTWHVSPKLLPSISRSHQFRRIQDAAKIVSPGDSVVIHSGVYRESVAIEKSGTREKPIRFQAAPGAKVVVTGLDRLSKWRKESANIYSTDWPYRFISWSKTNAYPDDEYHRLIGRAEQVVVDDQLLRQTLQRDQLSPGTFYVDLTNKRLYVCAPSGQDLRSKSVKVHAATRSTLLECKGAYVALRAITFRHAANPAQRGAVIFEGHGDSAENCKFEATNGSGVAFVGVNQMARRCTFQNNGQLGFGAGGAHGLLISDCTIRNNNTKGFNHQWEAGGAKVVLSRDVVFEKCRVTANHGPAVWFDTGCENGAVHNCLIADNEDAGISYEISYRLCAHDNVIVGNGFAPNPSAWGGQAGIVLSSSPNCVIERNLVVGNREGFNFREQSRITPRIDNPDPKHEEPIWNHDERICNNVIAYNRDAQTRGWFDVDDQRHWPTRLQTPASNISLDTLGIVMTKNIYARQENQPLFIWGTDWRRHATYLAPAEVQSELNLEQGSQLLPLTFRSLAKRDLRLPQNSAVFRMQCYPLGQVPDVLLGSAP
jgi:parallel beta-helix repeat protein